MLSDVMAVWQLTCSVESCHNMHSRLNPKTLSATRRASLKKALLCWYEAHKRDLPWRKTRDPYRIWVSEIMLQQTRVAAVLEYYGRFLERFPTVEALANADLQEVLAAWSGLGYYRRARAMHEAAKAVASRGGVFPASPKELLDLPGIGRYTAAAIASIAFQYPVAVVDGNVERVLTRISGTSLGKEDAWKIAEELLSRKRPGDWNQAMMELGATVCAPLVTDCAACPVRRWCVSKGTTPVPKQLPRHKKELTYGVARHGQSVQMVQRASNDSLMAGMWELPALESTGEKVVLLRVKHAITNSDYAVTVVEIGRDAVSHGEWIAIKRLNEIPLTGLARKILRKLAIMPESAAAKN